MTGRIRYIHRENGTQNSWNGKTEKKKWFHHRLAAGAGSQIVYSRDLQDGLGGVDIMMDGSLDGE